MAKLELRRSRRSGAIMKTILRIAALAGGVFGLATIGFAQTAAPAPPAPPSPTPTGTAPPLQAAASDGTMLLTVFMRHDQSKNLKEINETIAKNGYFDQFPPPGVEVVSWYVVMGVGADRDPEAAARKAARGQRGARKHHLGPLPDGLLSDLRLQAVGRAAKADDAGATAVSMSP